MIEINQDWYWLPLSKEFSGRYDVMHFVQKESTWILCMYLKKKITVYMWFLHTQFKF